MVTPVLTKMNIFKKLGMRENIESSVKECLWKNDIPYMLIVTRVTFEKYFLCVSLWWWV